MGFQRKRSLFLTCTLGWFSILINRLGYIIASLLCMSLPTMHLVLIIRHPVIQRRDGEWRIRHQRLIECLPSCHVPKPTTGQISPFPPCAGNACAQKLSTSERYQGWGNMQREEYMWPDTVGDPRVFQGCSMHLREEHVRTQCIQVKEMPSSLLQEGVRTTPIQSGGPCQSLSYCWLALLPSLVYIRLKWNSWPHSHMLGKPSTN